MARKKTEYTPKLQAYLSKEAMLEVSPNGGFIKISRTGEASLASNVVRERYSTVYLTRAELEKAIQELASHELITLPKSHDDRLDELRTWLDAHYTGVTVGEVERLPEDDEPANTIDICLNGIRLDIKMLNDIHQEAGRLFPGIEVCFQ